MCTLATVIVTKENWICWIEPNSLIHIGNSIPDCHVITLLSNHAVIRHQIFMRFVMCRQRRVPIECFFTNLAFKGPLVGVDDLVSAQGAGESKTLPTSWAGKWSVTGVFRHSHMLFESVLGFKDFPTMRAVVFRISGFSKQLVSVNMTFADGKRNKINCVSMSGFFRQVLPEVGRRFIGNWFTTHFLSMSFNSCVTCSNFFRDSWSSFTISLTCIQKKRVNLIALKGIPVHRGKPKLALKKLHSRTSNKKVKLKYDLAVVLCFIH